MAIDHRAARLASMHLTQSRETFGRVVLWLAVISDRHDANLRQNRLRVSELQERLGNYINDDYFSFHLANSLVPKSAPY